MLLLLRLGFVVVLDLAVARSRVHSTCLAVFRMKSILLRHLWFVALFRQLLDDSLHPPAVSLPAAMDRPFSATVRSCTFTLRARVLFSALQPRIWHVQRTQGADATKNSRPKVGRNTLMVRESRRPPLLLVTAHVTVVHAHNITCKCHMELSNGSRTRAAAQWPRCWPCVSRTLHVCEDG